jgi:hypothetical protein
LKSAYAGEASKAIDAIVAHPEDWSLDCGQIVQILQMYARMHMLGPRAWSKDVGELRLEYRDSRGLGASVSYFPSLNATTGTPHSDEYVGSGGGPEKKLAAVLEDAPIGSLVIWTKPNEVRSVDNPYQSENAVKIGSDSYWCHGFTKNPYTRAAFELEYSQHGAPGPVYIAEVTYVTHPAPR